MQGHGFLSFDFKPECCMHRTCQVALPENKPNDLFFLTYNGRLYSELHRDVLSPSHLKPQPLQLASVGHHKSSCGQCLPCTENSNARGDRCTFGCTSRTFSIGAQPLDCWHCTASNVEEALLDSCCSNGDHVLSCDSSPRFGKETGQDRP